MMNTDTDIDVTVIDHLDFEPACEMPWHKTDETATHVGRSGCCGSPRLMGQDCVQLLLEDSKIDWRYRCTSCGSHFLAADVELDRL